MCKHSNVLSRPVLMLRGLDGYFDLVLKCGQQCGFQGPEWARSLTTFGGDCEGVTPFPIPKRAVKPLSADGTWASRSWESRSPPDLHSGRPSGRPVLFIDWYLMTVIEIVLIAF